MIFQKLPKRKKIAHCAKIRSIWSPFMYITYICCLRFVITKKQLREKQNKIPFLQGSVFVCTTFSSESLNYCSAANPSYGRQLHTTPAIAQPKNAVVNPPTPLKNGNDCKPLSSRARELLHKALLAQPLRYIHTYMTYMTYVQMPALVCFMNKNLLLNFFEAL
jgi:hypothetical protein